MRKLITCIAVAATILSGCTKVEYITPVAPNEEVEISNLELTAALPDTRTYLEEHDSKTPNVKVLWSEGDSLSVWSNKTALVHRYDIVNKFTKEDGTEIGAGYPVANFVYDPTKPGATDPSGVVGDEFYAIYPYKSETVCVGNVATINLPTEQVCDFTGNFNPDYNPMAAVGTKLNGLEFKNLCGIIVIDIIPDQTLTVERIVLTTRNQPICGKANVTLKAGSDPTISFTERSQTTLTLYPENISISPKEDDTPYPFYLVVPAQPYTQLEVKIFTSYDDGSTPTLRKIRKTSMKVDGGKITRIGANFKLKTIPDPEPIPPHAYKVGDVYPFEGTPEGIVFALTNPTKNAAGEDESTTGKIVSLTKIDEQKKFYYTNVQSEFNISAFGANEDNGLANLKQAENSLAENTKLADVFPAYGAVQALGDNWYIPAINELNTLLNAKTVSKVNQTYKSLGNSSNLIVYTTINASTPANISNAYCSSTAFIDADDWVCIESAVITSSKLGYKVQNCIIMDTDTPDAELAEYEYYNYTNKTFKIIAISTFVSE